MVNTLQGQCHKQHETELIKYVKLDWIMKLQTKHPLYRNDNIMGICYMSRTLTVNVMDIVSKHKRSVRSHHRPFNRKRRKHHRNTVSFQGVIYVFKINGIHYLLCKWQQLQLKFCTLIGKNVAQYFTVVLLYESALAISAFISKIIREHRISYPILPELLSLQI